MNPKNPNSKIQSGNYSNFRFGKGRYDGKTDGADRADPNRFLGVPMHDFQAKKSKKIRFNLPNPFSHRISLFQSGNCCENY
jgi:hypothetical protein